MNLTRIQIQEKLLKDFSLKGFISEKEIEECCENNSIDIFEIDKIIEFLLDKNVLISNSAQNFIEKDDDELYDKAQIDYDAFYTEVLKQYPAQKIFINELKGIKPPQKNEWKTLLPQAKNGNNFAKKRIILMYLRTVYRQAFIFSKSYGSEFENSFFDGIEGLYRAIESYDFTSQVTFPSYYSFFILSSMQRKYKKINTFFILPNHYYQDMFQFLNKYKHLIEKYGIDFFWDFVPEKKLMSLEKNFLIYLSI